MVRRLLLIWTTRWNWTTPPTMASRGILFRRWGWQWGPLSSINSAYTKIIWNILVALNKGGCFPHSPFYKEILSWNQSKWLIEVFKLFFVIFGRKVSEGQKRKIVTGTDQVWEKNWGTVRQSYRVMAEIFSVLLLCFSKQNASTVSWHLNGQKFFLPLCAAIS